MRYANFQMDDGNVVQVEIRCRGPKNSRVVFEDGHDELVPSERLTEVPPSAMQTAHAHGDRIVPVTPLRYLYRDLRDLQGSRNEKFEGIRSRLEGRHGPQRGEFVAELFKRSRTHMEFYNNSDEPFFQDGKRPGRKAVGFANRLVELLMLGNGDVRVGNFFQPVNYEISPLRTTRSCWGSGEPATDSGAGGMDLLLVDNEFRPVIGEIKARTESVGPTFALIQALTYMSELATRSQWQRLRQFFGEKFANCQDTVPKIGIAIIFEAPFTPDDDLAFAKNIAQSLSQDEEVARYLTQIRFLTCQINDGCASFELL